MDLITATRGARTPRPVLTFATQRAVVLIIAAIAIALASVTKHTAASWVEDVAGP